jgi:hypothetical protein
MTYQISELVQGQGESVFAGSSFFIVTFNLVQVTMEDLGTYKFFFSAVHALMLVLAELTSWN